MESVSADEARRSLESIGAARLDVAERLTTPLWYYLALGLLVAHMVLVYGFADGSLPALSGLVVAVGALLLVRTVARRTGVIARIPCGARSRVAFAGFALGLVGPTLYVVLVPDLPAGVVVALSALVLLSTLVLGPVYDAAYRADLRHQAAA